MEMEWNNGKPYNPADVWTINAYTSTKFKLWEKWRFTEEHIYAWMVNQAKSSKAWYVFPRPKGFESTFEHCRMDFPLSWSTGSLGRRMQVENDELATQDFSDHHGNIDRRRVSSL